MPHKRKHREEKGRMLIKDQFILLLNPPGVPLLLALSPRYIEMTVRRGAGQAPTEIRALLYLRRVDVTREQNTEHKALPVTPEVKTS